MRGNLIPAGLDGMAAMDRRHYHQHIGSAVDLYWYYSGLAIWAMQHESPRKNKGK